MYAWAEKLQRVVSISAHRCTNLDAFDAKGGSADSSKGLKRGVFEIILVS
jgi:hypothetical protein